MALEGATYISQLVPTNPDGGDDRSQGDDHIRLIKSAIKNTFPNINNVVNATDEQLNAATETGVLCFPGMIVMWSGTIGTIPSGWKLCNGVGTISTGGAVPNLTDKFIIGTATAPGTTGGAASYTVPAGVTGSTSPSFNVPISGYGISGQQPRPGYTTPAGVLMAGRGDQETAEHLESINETTSGPSVSLPHTHTTSSVVVPTLPPYYALAFIIKN